MAYVYETKKGWKVQHRVKDRMTGKLRKETLPESFPTEQEAIAVGQLIEAKKKTGTLDLNLNKLNSVNDVLDYWYERYVTKRLRHNTVRDYEVKMKVIKAHIGEYRLASLSPADFDMFYDDLLDEGKTFGYVGKIHTIARTAFYYCYKKEQITKKYLDKVDVPKDDEEEKSKCGNDNYWSVDQLNEWLPLFHDDHLWFNIYMSLHLGLRAEETACVHIDDIDWKERTLYVHSSMQKLYGDKIKGSRRKIKKRFSNQICTGPLKNSSPYYVPLTGPMITFLKKRITDIKKAQLKYGELWDHEFDGYLSVYLKRGNDRDGGRNVPGRIIHDRRVVDRFRVQMKHYLDYDPEMKPLTFHGFRHSCASYLHYKGVDMKTIQEILNHSDMRMTQIYTHATEKGLSEKRKALENMDF